MLKYVIEYIKLITWFIQKIKLIMKTNVTVRNWNDKKQNHNITKQTNKQKQKHKFYPANIITVMVKDTVTKNQNVYKMLNGKIANTTCHNFTLQKKKKKKKKKNTKTKQNKNKTEFALHTEQSISKRMHWTSEFKVPFWMNMMDITRSLFTVFHVLAGFLISRHHVPSSVDNCTYYFFGAL